MPQDTLSEEGRQWYLAALPAVDEGRHVDYRIELIRAGQRLATLPTDGSWLTVTGQRRPVPSSVEQLRVQPAPAPSSAAAPFWTYNLTFFATLTAQLRPEVIGETPEGHRINFFIQSGRVVGSRIDAMIRPDGGDWICVRSDGIARPDVHITLEMADGALVLYRAGGVCDLGSDGYATIAAGQFVGCAPYYATPTFLTAHPNWKWLNRCQGVGIGRVVLEDLRVECDIYLPQVLERRSDG
jgi:hypothetical protein